MRQATVAEVRAAWDSMGAAASSRKVSDKLKAAGLAASNKTVAKLKREGWPGIDKPEAPAEKAAAEAGTALHTVVAQVTGKADAKVPVIPDDGAKNSTLTERTLRQAILGAERFAQELYAKMAEHALTPETTANSLGKLADAVNKAAGGLALLASLREGEMKDVPGTVEIITPEKQIESDPLRASLEAFAKAEQEHIAEMKNITPEPAGVEAQ